jgi:mono/diheme cytochrome c family protein
MRVLRRWPWVVLGVAVLCLFAGLAVLAFSNLLEKRVEPHYALPLDRAVKQAQVVRPDVLYVRHCSLCHGAKGDGHGTASRYLFPLPRDLRNDRLALVSTVNGVATRADVEQVLVQGMPGSSMPAFPALTEDERALLADDVLRLQREGIRERLLRAWREDEGEGSDEAEVRRAVAAATTPGPPVPVSADWGPPAETAASVERGRHNYLSLGCGKCHGKDGTGEGGEFQYDGRGEPVLARDLLHEPFKGGREPRSIYLRLALGMPGTPHPAVVNLSEEDLRALVQYVRSLERPPLRILTNFERRVRADARGETRTGS